MFHYTKVFSVIVMAGLLCACGGGDDDDDAAPPSGGATPPPTTRGSLIVSPPARLISVSADQLAQLTTAASGGSDLLKLITAPKCGVDVHQLRYNTVDPADQPTTASGALMIPTGSDPACNGAKPIMAYAHGTTAEKAYNLADLTNPDNAEGLFIAIAFAAQGYIVVAPNYAGFDPAGIPDDRRGVRESIVGRMKRHGGRADIHSEPGAGTEVQLTLERRKTQA